MKKFKKIIIIIFLWLFIFTIFGIVAVEAQQEIIFRPQVPIDGFGERRFEETGSTQYIAEYIVAIYRYGTSIGAILATVVLMAAGLMWLTSGGSQEKIGQAKNIISGSIIGLVLLFGSYTILNTINPELVNFHIREIDKIKGIAANPGCCRYWQNEIVYDGREVPVEYVKIMKGYECDIKKESDEIRMAIHYENKTIAVPPLNRKALTCVNAGCCTVSVWANALNALRTSTARNRGLTFPAAKSSCKSIRSTNILKVWTVISNWTQGACRYEKVLDCSNLTDGTKCYDASMSDYPNLSSIDCEREGVCGWCMSGVCINSFGDVPYSGDRDFHVCGDGTGGCVLEDSCNEADIIRSGRPCNSSKNLVCCRGAGLN